MTGGCVRIHMFSGPRNISTTMMRAFENRPDTAVVDEPFYASWLARSGAEHPYRAETLAAQPHDPASVVAWLRQSPENFGKPGAGVLFAKHIAYHIEDAAALEALTMDRCMVLIRDPARMIASYAQKIDDVAPIAGSFRVSRRAHELLSARGRACPVVDAADILADPASMMRALCGALDIPFTESMLSWRAGARRSDGPWAPHWYDAVISSTGFRKIEEKPVDLPPALEALAALCRADYEHLHARRLIA